MEENTFSLIMGIMMGFCAGVLVMSIVFPTWPLEAEDVATQLCEFLDTSLIEFETNGWKFDYIKCGEPEKLIEGLDSEKLIEVLG